MKIGILGGTFNPIHKGHINAAKYVKEKLNLDEVWIIPVYKTPSKKTIFSKNNPKVRYEIVKKTVNDLNLSWLKVKNYEQKIKGVSYTYKTIKYVKEKFPVDDFYLIIGDDLYENLPSWKQFDYLMEQLKFVILRRTKQIKENIENDKRFIYLKDKYLDISSSNTLSSANWDNIEDTTKLYLTKNFLYIKDIVFFKLNEYEKTKKLKNNLYVHSLSVAKHAKKLASKNKYKKTDKAYYAGLTHDLFKEEDPKMIRKVLEKETDWVLPNDKALHGFYAAYWFRDKYQIDDLEFINALKRHTIADEEMTKLDKIIFVADKIADDRKDEKAKKYRKLAYKNLNFTFEKLLKELIDKLNSNNIEPDKRTLIAYEKIKKENNSLDKPKKKKK